jgi:hypothetical protein
VSATEQSLIERKRKYARAIWDAMVSDEIPDNKTLWEYGYEDAADAVIRLADEELAHAAKETLQ